MNKELNFRMPSALTASDAAAIREKLANAIRTDAPGIGHFSSELGLCFLGIVAGGELVTWFLSPANDADDARRLQDIVCAGIQSVGADLFSLAQVASKDVLNHAARK